MVDVDAINDQMQIGESLPIRGHTDVFVSVFIKPSVMVLVSAKGWCWLTVHERVHVP